jgi:hypothetical protein
MAAALPVISIFMGNRYEAAVQDLVVPTILILFTALIPALAFARTWRHEKLVALVAAMTSALIFATDYESRLDTIYPILKIFNPLPKVLDWPFYSLVLIAMVLFVSYWLGRLVAFIVRRQKWSHHDVTGGVAFALVATFLLNIVPLAWTLAVEWPQFFYKPPTLPAASAAAKTAAKPDIYYIVLDRYASSDVLKSQFGYDNSSFLNSLTDMGYYINNSAHNNYPYTTMSIASTMSAGYDNDIISRFASSSQQTTIPFNETIRNSPVAADLQSIGYKYTLVGNWYETSNRSDIADTVYQQTGSLTFMGDTYTLNNFSKNFLTASLPWRFINGAIKLGDFTLFNYQNLGDVDMHHYELSTLNRLVDSPSGGRFIFAHILLPHDPYYFNADGSLSNNSSGDNYGKTIKKKYLNQLQYVNSQMKTILGKINANSHGQAVVLLQADEGPYPTQLNDEVFDETAISGELGNGDMTGWSLANLQMKYGNLAAYHIPAVDFTQPAVVDAADNANVFRLVLNNYFGYNFGYLPDCYYAYPNGREKPIIFTDITKKLTGKDPDPRCLADGSVK